MSAEAQDSAAIEAEMDMARYDEVLAEEQRVRAAILRRLDG